MKIQIIAKEPDHIQLEPMLRPPIRKKLQDLGIEFVTSNPDAILYHTYKATPEIKKKISEITLPIMIVERIAAARILSRKEIKRDNVIGVLKDAIYRDLKIDNVDYVAESKEYPDKSFKNNYHSKLIFQSLKQPCEYYFPKPLLEDKDFEKVNLWYSFASYAMMKPFLKDVNHSVNRSLDISFWGTTKYGPSSQAITLHRKKCVDQIQKLKNCSISCFSDRVSGKTRYVNCLFASKVGISPWGLGEKCYRDFEAIYAGSILLKPDTSFVLDWTDTYDSKNKYYIPCKIDFSDLQEKVDYIKDNWKTLAEFRRDSRDRLIKKCWNEDILATFISDTFKKCVSRIKK